MAEETVDYNVGEEEGQEILRIVTEYFRQQTESEEDAQLMLQKLATLVQGDGAKLVHLGKTVFLVIVKGKGLVEVHSMAVDETSSSLAKNFVDLAKYLKGIGVKVAYTYTDEPVKYAVVTKRSKLPFQQKVVTGPDGKKYTAYYLELK